MAGLAPINPLLECCAELLAVAMPLRWGRDSAELPADLRERVLAGFDTLEHMAFERQLPAAAVEDAKYALAAFVDESVLASEWPGRVEWMSQPLQLGFFGEHLAGEGFFRRLNALRQGGEPNADLLELYYVCLQLGFEGVYRLRGLEQLMALQVDLRSQIDAYRGISDPRLSDDGTPRVGVFQRVGRHLPYWVIASVTAATVLLGYTGYLALSQRATEAAVVSIASAADSLVQTRLAPVTAGPAPGGPAHASEGR